MTGNLVTDLQDPRLNPYRDIRNKNWLPSSGLFIAEGPLLVQRLVASDSEIQSVLLDEKFAEQYAAMVGPEVELLVIRHDVVAEVVGFHFHRGVLACGLRKPLQRVPEHFPDVDARETMVAVMGVQDPENLGSIMRTSAALGIEHVILGPGTADPLGRRALRVSMGRVLQLTLYRTNDIISDLAWLHEQRKVESLASSLAAESIAMDAFRRRGPVVLLFGNERLGLPREVQQAADHRIRIDMNLHDDSLNVGVAAGILLHHVCRLT